MYTMKHISKQQYGRYLGLLGAVSLLIGVAVWTLQMTFSRTAAIFSLIGLLCVLLYIVLNFKQVQAQLVKRSVKYGANTTVMILIVFGIIVLVEAISMRHDVQFDLTKDKRYTLSEQTVKLMESLAQDITVIGFFTPDYGGRDMLESLLKQYNSLSSRLTFEIVDPVKNPGRAQAYDITTNGTIVLETPQKQEKIFEPTEEALTSGLIKVTREGTKVLYFISGHGEHGLDDQEEAGLSQIKQALENANYAVEDLLLLQESAIPEDAAVVVLAGPQKNLLPTELDALNAYIHQGGRVVCMFDPGQASDTAKFLEPYGVTLDETTVIDVNPLGQLMGAGPGMPIASSYAQHPITERFTSATIFPLARSLTLAESFPEGVSAEQLAGSSPESWAETSADELTSGNVSFTEGSDIHGPLTLAAVITVSAPSAEETATDETTDETVADETTQTPDVSEGRIVVFGDSDFASNAYVGWSGNGDLMLNTLNWLAEEDDLVAVRAKDPEMSPLMLTAAQARMGFLLTVLVMPLAVIITGITVYVKRRNATR